MTSIPTDLVAFRTRKLRPEDRGSRWSRPTSSMASLGLAVAGLTAAKASILHVHIQVADLDLLAHDEHPNFLDVEMTLVRDLLHLALRQVIQPKTPIEVGIDVIARALVQQNRGCGGDDTTRFTRSTPA